MVNKEEDNFLRVVYLNYRVGTTALRRYFDNVHPNLQSDLSSPANISRLSSLYKPPRGQKRVLYKEQWNILYPSTGSRAVSSIDLDVTLMVCLLRNLPPEVTRPADGFDDLPQSSDLSPGAHIARIKYYKNFIVSHSKDGKLPDNDFNTIWIDMEMAINGLGNQQDVIDATDAKTKLLDYSALQEQVNLSDNIQQNRKRLNEQSVELAEHSGKIAKLETTVEHLAKGNHRSEKAETTCKKAKLETTAEHIEKGVFKEFKDKLVHSTVLDKEVLDYLISKCIILLDDREDINRCTDQSSRNQKLLKLLSHRPYNTFSILVEAMKRSDQKCHTLTLANMEAKVSDKVVTLQKVPLKDEIADIENQTVKLIKWYKTIVNNIDIDKTGILDKLKDVLSSEENAEIRSISISQQEKNRGLLGKIIRKINSSGNTIFLEVLKEDSCYKEFATKIEETNVTQFDLDLLYIGNSLRERKRRKRDRKRRRKNGMTDFMIDQIEKWEKDESLYIETRATKHALSCVSKYNCVSVIGPSGCGKTALVRHIALQLETYGYTILTVTYAKDIKKQYKSGRKTLYIVDDMCGNFTANQTRIEEWKKSMNDIKSILENGNCKLILTCRLQVFKDKMFANLEIFKTCECNLRSEGLSLTPMEKENMTTQYFKEHALEALKRLGEFEFLPLLCKLYHVQRNDPQFNLDFFLNDAFSFYKKELPRMYDDCTEGKYKYCALLLLVIFNNKLEDKNFKGEDRKLKEIIEDIIEVCEIDKNITHVTSRKLMSQLQILIGTFVTYDDGIFKTIHDKLFDFLAFYFGTQEQIIDILIKNAKDRFVCERFVVTDDNKSSRYSILISSDKLQMYMKRVFDDLVSSSDVNDSIVENKNLKNVNFRTLLIDFMRQLSKHEITSIMGKANAIFLNIMFVMRNKDIKDKVADVFQEYKCFGIVLPDDMLHQYIDKWFNALLKTYSTEKIMKENRLLKCVSFCTALPFYMRQLNTENVASIIQTGSKDFLNTMFVMAENDVIHSAKKPNERFGIVIPESLLQHYIGRWFDDLQKHVGENICANGICMVSSILRLHMEKTWLLGEVINKNRPLKNLGFRTALRIYIRNLTTEQIASLIHTSGDSFLNTMFVMTEDDINDSAENRYEWFGIVIPDNMLQQYIEKIFNGLTNEFWMVKNIDMNRVFNNSKGRTALCTHMKQLTKEKIAALIQNAGYIFFNAMFVMTEEDIKDSAKNKYECFGIVIPDDLLQQYIERWFADLTKTSLVEAVIKENRPLINVTFRSVLRTYIRQLTTEKIISIIHTGNDDFINKMFVMTEDEIKDNAENGYECLGIVIPYDLLQQYIQRWFEDLTKTYCVENILDENRLLLNVTFLCALSTYMRQLTTEKIASIIQTTQDAFLNTMFVMSQDDIKGDEANRHECLCIVIPDDLLQQYIQRMLYILTKSIRIESAINKNRPLMNVMFRSAVRTCMKQVPKDKIASIIHEAKESFLNTMFFMTEEDIKDDFANRHECFGIVIPDDLLRQYIERWFECLTEPNELDKFSAFNYLTGYNWVENFMEICRPLNNVRFRMALRTYMRQLNTDKIGYLIQTARYGFINTMFVMTEDDVNDNSENQYERFGIVIPNDLLQQYIARWFAGLIKTSKLEKIQDKNRVMKNVTFRIAFQTYMRTMNTEKIADIIQTAEYDFINTMFVMTEDDIKDYATNRRECYGIVIPDKLLQQYIKRWFDDLTKTDRVKDIIDKNRPLLNVQFRSVIRTYMKQLVTKQIDLLINTAGDSFLNTMFVMTEEDIKENAGNQNECLGIVIPDGLLQQYIQRLFDVLKKTFWIEGAVDQNRPMMNVMFRNTVRTYMKQLPTDEISSIIKEANDSFLKTMFFMTEEDIKDGVANRHECFGIVFTDELLQQYIARWFERLTETSELKKNELILEIRILGETRLVDNFIEIRKHLNNVRFRTAFRTYIRQLNTDKIGYLIQTARYDFINTMFVMTEDDVNDNSENQYERVGIVIPNDLLQQYIARWFAGLIKTSKLEKIQDKNRVMKNVTFRIAFQTYMRTMNTEKIADIIQTAEYDFINTMFVMTEDDIKDYATNRNKCYGIVIPDELLQQYIQRWFVDLTKTDKVKEIIDKNRPLLNVQFRSVIRTYMRQLTKNQIDSHINTAEDSFLNTMFVMTNEDIEDDAANLYECFGIVIPDDLLQQYIARWFECLTEKNDLEKQLNEITFLRETCWIENFMEICRPLHNVRFRTALRTYIRQLNTDKTGYLIQTARYDCINTMFVMTEDDVNNNSEKQYERFGIKIPDDLLQQYIERWFKRLNKTSQLKNFIVKNRLLKNVTFCTALCNYMRKLNTEKIADLIWNAKNYFLNTMFVMTEEDIQDNAKNCYECLGIVIPDDLLQQYIAKWFERLTKTSQLEKFIDENRPLRSIAFRTSLCCNMRQLTTEKIVSLIWNAGAAFLNKMFVITEEDIKDNAENQHDCFGIIIPDDLLQQYTERWFNHLTNARCVKEFMDTCRPLKNVTFCSTLCNYMRQLNTKTISSLIQTANNDFINTMFVMIEADLTDTSENRYECFGIVLPDNLLQQYIERWFECLIKTMELEKYINKNRPMKNVTFCTALRNHMKQFNIEKMGSLIQTAKGDFINKMFVMTADDIKDNTDNRYEYLGCVIPDSLLQIYIERWLNCVTQSDSAIEYMNYTRPLINVTFRNELRTYLRQLNTEQIWTLILTKGRDFLNTMFVMNEEDINDNAENHTNVLVLLFLVIC